MDLIRILHRDRVVACHLEPTIIADRLGAWRDLRARYGLGAEPLARGARIWLHPGGRVPAERLVREEAACCAFLDLELATDGERLRLDLTSPAPGGRTVAGALAGLDLEESGPAGVR